GIEEARAEGRTEALLEPVAHRARAAVRARHLRQRPGDAVLPERVQVVREGVGAREALLREVDRRPARVRARRREPLDVRQDGRVAAEGPVAAPDLEAVCVAVAGPLREPLTRARTDVVRRADTARR